VLWEKLVALVIKNLEKRKIKKFIILYFILSLFFFNDAISNESGKVLSFVAGCYGCHTSNPNQPFGGGYEVKTKYGTFISPNISKDELNGIGNWSKEQFIKAIKEGLSPKNKPYYPVFPYNWYAKMKESDILEIYDYIFNLPAVKKNNANHDLIFPYNIRDSLWFWRLANKIITNKNNIEYNSKYNSRGEYLVNSVGHCGACHAPLTFLSIIKDYNNLGGRKETSKFSNDSIPNISNDIDEGIGLWTESDIVFFLQTGIKPNGDFVEEDMALIIDHGTKYLKQDALQDIARYLLKIKK